MNLSAGIKEKDFRQTVVDFAKYRHWSCYFTWNSMHSPAGFPDLVLVKERADGTARLIFAELKTEKGKLSIHQEGWLSTLRQVPGISVFLWRPSMWEAIVETLEAEK